MDAVNTITSLHPLEAAKETPISELCPELSDLHTRAVCGIVTITWPYNSVKGTFAFNLAEPDFRLRRNKGQVRVNFTGRAAKALGDSKLGCNDEVRLGLEGVTWEAEGANKRQSLPSSDLGWQLIYSERLSIKIKRAETGDVAVVTITEPASLEHETTPDPTPTSPTSYIRSPPPPTPLSPVRAISPVRDVGVKKLNDGEFASPAFIKRARMSYGSLFEGGLDIFEDDGSVKGKGRKRTKFGRESSAWRYSSQSPSPEPTATSPGSVHKHPSSSTRAEMTDDGCQTMELDDSTSQTVETVETQGATALPQSTAVDTPANLPAESEMTQNAQTLLLGSRLSVPPAPSSVHVASTRIPQSDVTTLPPLSDPRYGSVGQNFEGLSWNTSLAPSPLEPNQNIRFAPLPIDGLFSSSGFEIAASAGQSIPFNELEDLRANHSGDTVDEEHMDDAVIPSESNPAMVNYPPLDDLKEDIRAPPIHDEALTNYPTNYLDEDHASQRNSMAAQTPEYPATTGTGPSSWVTVNNTSQATAAPPTDRLSSTGGETPEQALVIDESNLDEDSEPEPTAAEDTIDEGRADALDMYDDAEAEDEVDAQYSDDDEPEYDADEIGGDYDARNYEHPDDDEDDSHDEDLQPHTLEPEFDDGESWDEEDQEGEEFDEGEYRMDYEVPRPAPQPRSNPMVIDLISSSEDEGEDEAESEGEGDDTNIDIQRSSAHITSRTPDLQTISRADVPGHILNDNRGRVHSQHEHVPFLEEEVEEVEDGDESEENEQAESESEASYEEMEQQAIPKVKPAYDTEKTEERDIETTPPCRTTPQEELRRSISIGVRNDLIETPAEENSAVVPFSASDGLEMLSRAIENESNANSKIMFTEEIVEQVVVEASYSHQPHLELPREDISRIQDSPIHRRKETSEKISDEIRDESDEDDQVDLIAPSRLDTEHQPPISGKEYLNAAPSSPPLTQSFQSHTGEQASAAFRDTTITIEDHRSNIQLLTPLETQVTDIVQPENSITNSPTDVGGSFETQMAIQEESKLEERIDSGGPVDDVLQQEISMDVDKDRFEQQREVTPAIQHQASQPLDDLPPASPALSFQTQVDDEALALPDSLERTTVGARQLRQGNPENDSNASNASVSFKSHMEIDEELQASILVNSQLDDESLNGLARDDGHDPLQVHTNEGTPAEVLSRAHIKPETAQETEASSPMRDTTPTKQLSTGLSAQLQRNLIEEEYSPAEQSDASTQEDPSVHLARAANASKQARKNHDVPTDEPRSHTRVLDAHRSPTPETENSSIQLARASFASQPLKPEEDNSSMTAAKLNLVRHLRDELSDCTSLKILRQHLTKSLDVIAVAMMQPPEPRRAKGGPREYMMSFTVTDHSIGPYAVAEVLIYRPHKDTLPVVKYGDIVLLRNFTVVSLTNKGFGLKTNDASSWAVFDHEDQPAQIKGPPVEYGESETTYATYLREWFGLLDDKAKAKLERANQKFINTGKSK